MLTLEETDERIALYLSYRDAVVARDEQATRFPVQPPEDFTVASPAMVYADLNDLHALVLGAWSSLREAVLGRANRAVDEAYKRVVAFEAGEEV